MGPTMRKRNQNAGGSSEEGISANQDTSETCPNFFGPVLDGQQGNLTEEGALVILTNPRNRSVTLEIVFCFCDFCLRAHKLSGSACIRFGSY